MNEEFFEELGRLVGPLPELLVAVSCRECQEIWYIHERAEESQGRTDRYCPSCGGQSVYELTSFPGALVLKSWVDWQRDRPSMDTGPNPWESQSETT